MKIFLFHFCNYQGKMLFHCVCLFSIYSIHSYLIILIRRICREINRYNCLKTYWTFCKKQGTDGMKFCSVGIPNLGMESEQTYVRRVAKRQSTRLGRSMNDCCWNPTDIDNEDGVILKGKSNIRVCLLRCVTPYEKGQKSAWIESLIGGQILKRQCANCTLHCFFFG